MIGYMNNDCKMVLSSHANKRNDKGTKLATVLVGTMVNKWNLTQNILMRPFCSGRSILVTKSCYSIVTSLHFSLFSHS